jgi:L-rhamnose mutarotase
MERHGMVIRLRPEMYETYKRLHTDISLEVLDLIRKHNLRNYSIYHKDGWLFSYYEYAGTSYASDMARLAESPIAQAFWKLSGPCQEPLPTRGNGEWWAGMEELFHLD